MTKPNINSLIEDLKSLAAEHDLDEKVEQQEADLAIVSAFEVRADDADEALR